jgi:hypothetical protein
LELLRRAVLLLFVYFEQEVRRGEVEQDGIVWDKRGGADEQG